ncbi:MAG: hypothetical protein GXZ07_10305 [Firmicutes bacterium]|nr:hypothetical protein [Bacillota bacterium]
MNIYDCAHALVKAIKSSPEYKNFKAAKEKLQEDSDAKKMISDLRKIQWNMQKQKISGIEIAPEQEKQLSRLLEVANLNLVVKEYLEAEYKFSIILTDIQKIISEAMQDILSSEIWEQVENEKGQNGSA